MTEVQLQRKADMLFPLPKKEEYVGGEAFIWETDIIKQRQRDWMDGARYADRPIPWIMIGWISGIVTASLLAVILLN